MKLSRQAIIWFAILALAAAGWAADGPEASGGPEASVTPAPSVAPPVLRPASAPAQPEEPIDDFAPGLFGFVVVLGAIMLILVGAGIVAAVVTVLAAAMLVGLGIISTSVAVGFVQRRARAGFRVFFLLCGAAGGVPAGIGTTMTVSWLFGLHIPWRWIIGGGALVGALAGLAVAAIFNFAWGRIIDFLIRKVGQR